MRFIDPPSVAKAAEALVRHRDGGGNPRLGSGVTSRLLYHPAHNAAALNGSTAIFVNGWR